MAGTLEERLAAAYAARREKQWIARRLDDARAERAHVAAQVAAAADLIAYEKHDVDRLRLGIAGFLRGLLAKSSELSREEQELATARLQRDQRIDELAAIDADLAQLETRASAVRDADHDYARALGEKEATLRAQGGPQAERLFAIAEQEGRLRAARREVDEAIAAGHAAHEALLAVQVALGSWSAERAVGAGAIVGLRMLGVTSARTDVAALEAARPRLVAAEHNLRRFQRECGDVKLDRATEVVALTPLPSVGELLLPALAWISGAGALEDTQTNVSQLISCVTSAVLELRGRRGHIDRGLEQLMEQRATLVDARPGRL